MLRACFSSRRSAASRAPSRAAPAEISTRSPAIGRPAAVSRAERSRPRWASLHGLNEPDASSPNPDSAPSEAINRPVRSAA